ncbi:unnamed protein product [Taenia asiatica]|uniref:Type I-B CRISPR-associated protein Cas7/Cst2/DevR n=1 Tax=Taenia asiatica TaxID=60517 RepID=A0A0R3W4G8_TAEAS|nr:unnamed protein product [Taenia asiatica]
MIPDLTVIRISSSAHLNRGGEVSLGFAAPDSIYRNGSDVNGLFDHIRRPSFFSPTEDIIAHCVMNAFPTSVDRDNMDEVLSRAVTFPLDVITVYPEITRWLVLEGRLVQHFVDRSKKTVKLSSSGLTSVS